MEPESRQRLFIAISYQPSPEVSDLLLRLQKCAEEPATRLKVVAESNLHITLKFLGMVPAMEIAQITQVMDRLGSRSSGFELTAEGIGCFRNSLWLGIEKNQPLQNLALSLDRELAKAGFPSEPRNFLPHITIARIGRDGKINVSELQEKSGSSRWGTRSVAEIHLYQSNTLPSGATYRILHSSQLTG